MTRQDLTLLATRITIALVFLWHGVPKAIDPQMAADKFIGFGLPGPLGPAVGLVEVAAALLLLTGLLHRAASLALAGIIVGALVTVQIPAGISAGLERDMLILAATLSLAAHGPGRLRIPARRPTARSRRESFVEPPRVPRAIDPFGR